MAQANTINLEWTTLATSSTGDAFFPATAFRSAVGLGNCRGWLEMRARFGTAQVELGFQTANDPRQPDAAVAIPVNVAGSPGYAAADGVFDPSPALVTMSTTDKKLIRFGWIIKVSSGTGGARVQGAIQTYF